jgi:hypothetical protein
MDPIRMRIGKENRDVSSMYFIYVLVGSIPYISDSWITLG